MSDVSATLVSDSCFSHLVRVPIDRVDLAAWLTALTSGEFRRCCPGEHLAAGASTGADGHALTVAAETIGGDVLVHRYRHEVAGPHRCRLVSTSDAFGPRGWSAVRVVWELRVEVFDARGCEYVNRLVASSTDGASGLSDATAGAHNEQETPLLAASVERHALGAARA